MKTNLDHLPAAHQEEMEHIKQVLMREFAAAIAGGTQAWRRNGKVLKIVLFGSFARDDWVDEPDNGYQSDYDLLIVVSHEKLTDIADHWYVAEDKLLHDPRVKRTVNIIVHTLADVNRALTKGEYFWADVMRDGVMLHELPGHPLVTSTPLSPMDAYKIADRYFAEWLPAVDRALRTAELQRAEGGDSASWCKEAVFMLHQATERAYACILLVLTFYFPRSHNVKFLRSLAEDKDKRLITAWPRETKIDRRRFELLKRAYVEARYSDQYAINVADLEAISRSVDSLRTIVDAICVERLAALRAAAAG
jgi:predicted nucleotidyltransferase/HEPN domain-containing protein